MVKMVIIKIFISIVYLEKLVRTTIFNNLKDVNTNAEDNSYSMYNITYKLKVIY